MFFHLFVSEVEAYILGESRTDFLHKAESTGSLNVDSTIPVFPRLFVQTLSNLSSVIRQHKPEFFEISLEKVSWRRKATDRDDGSEAQADLFSVYFLLTNSYLVLSALSKIYHFSCFVQHITSPFILLHICQFSQHQNTNHSTERFIYQL